MSQDELNLPARTVIGVPAVLAIVIVIMWLITLVIMMIKIGATTDEWSRWITIMTSLQALAFAAAGALWGVKVQEKETEKAKGEAAKANKNSAEGKKLADMVLKMPQSDADPKLWRGATGTDDLREQAWAVLSN
jgi:NADH:ubiquinone oxidoreductase subunit 6 (subunit J)